MGVLIRAEAVDLGKTLGSTSDLSTMRGASLIMTDAVVALRAALEAEFAGRIETVNQGGSLGLFFVAVDDADPEDLEARALGWLSGAIEPPGPLDEEAKRDWALARLVRFEVHACRSEAISLAADAETLLARQRWRQMQAPRLVPPAADPALDTICGFDGVSPGKAVKLEKSSIESASPHALAQRRYGISRKHRLYQKFFEREARDLKDEALGLDLSAPMGLPRHFARHMDELAVDERAGRLSGKIALIYADGNRFGQLQRAIVQEKPLPGKGRLALSDAMKDRNQLKRQRWFDRRLRAYRAALLKSLLVMLMTDHAGAAIFRAPEDDVDEPRHRRKGEAVMRLETQLWAGDEMIWALPAALALPALQLLFDTTEGWEVEGEGLTHAIGMVLCHHDAPIGRIRSLAFALAGHGKRLLAQDSEGYFLGALDDLRRGDVVAYEVLESFDHLGTDPERYREDRLHATGCQSYDMVLTPARTKALIALGKILRQPRPPLARRQIKRLAQSLHAGGPSDPLFVKTEARLKDEVGRFWADEIDELREKAFGPALWLHLDALYDYLPAGADDVPEQAGDGEVAA